LADCVAKPVLQGFAIYSPGLGSECVLFFRLRFRSGFRWPPLDFRIG